MPTSANFAQKPLQLVSINSFGKLVLHVKAINFLRSLTSPISVLSIAGPYRTGKSFLLNSLLSSSTEQCFQVGHTTNSATYGLWIWGQPLLATNQENKITNVIVMDSEGYACSENTHDKRVVTLALLLSSCFLYNSKGPIDKDSVFDLQFVIQVARMIQKSRGECNQSGQQKQTLGRCEFHWVLRDFHLQLKNQLGNQITASQYMENCLMLAEEKVNQKTIQTLKDYFPNRQCHCLIQPNLDPSKEQRAEFVEQVLQLKKVFKHVRSFESQISGEHFVSIMESYVHAMNEGEEIQSVFQEGYDCKVRLECLEKLDGKLKKLEERRGIDERQLQRELGDIRNELRGYYRKRMCSQKQIDELDGDIEEIVQQYRTDKISTIITKIPKEASKEARKLSIPKNRGHEARLSIHCSQSDERQNLGTLEQIGPSKTCLCTIEKLRYDKETVSKMEDLELKIHRSLLQIESYEQEALHLRAQNEQLKVRLHQKDDEIITLLNQKQEKQHQLEKSQGQLSEKIRTYQEQLRMLQSQLDKNKTLYEQKVQFLNNQLEGFQIEKNQNAGEMKEKYKAKVHELTEEIRELKQNHEQELQKVKNIYQQRQEERLKSFMGLNNDSLSGQGKSLVEQFQQKTLELDQLKALLETYKFKEKSQTDSLQQLQFKYQQLQTSKREESQQSTKRYNELQQNLRMIYEGKMATKERYIRELEEKLRNLTKTLEEENKKLVEKLQELEGKHTEQKEGLFSLNNQLRNSCLESVKRVGTLREEIQLKEQRIRQLQKAQQETVEKNKAQVNDYEERIAKLKQQAWNFQKKLQQAQSAFNAELAACKENNRNNEQQIVLMGRKINQLSLQCEAEKNKSVEQSEKVLFMQEHLRQLQQRNNDLLNQLSCKEDQIVQLEGFRNQENLSKKRQLAEFQVLFQEKLRQAQLKLVDLQHKNKKLAIEKEELVVANTEQCQEQKTILQRRLRQLEEANNELQRNLRQQGKERAKLQSGKDELENKIIETRQALNHQQQINSQLSKELNCRQEEYKCDLVEREKQIALIRQKLQFTEQILKEQKDTSEMALMELEKKEKEFEEQYRQFKQNQAEKQVQLRRAVQELNQKRLIISQMASEKEKKEAELLKLCKAKKTFEKQLQLLQKNLVEMEQLNNEERVRYHNHLRLFSLKLQQAKKGKQRREQELQRLLKELEQVAKRADLTQRNYHEDYQLWTEKFRVMEKINKINKEETDNFQKKPYFSEERD